MSDDNEYEQLQKETYINNMINKNKKEKEKKKNKKEKGRGSKITISIEPETLYYEDLPIKLV